MQTGKFLSLFRTTLVFLLLVGKTFGAQKEQTVHQVIDRAITQLYHTKGPEELMKLDLAQVMKLFTQDELTVLSTCHWVFDVNVPATVSLMVSKEQKTLPFWIAGIGFQKTPMTVKNSQTTYDIWQKQFPKGRVGLGVNGFENGLALHYFVSVAPVNKQDKLQINPVIPVDQKFGVLQDGASTYMDWDELVLRDVPVAMTGQQLLTTTRGRASESHLVGAFRSTPYASSQNPDQIILTWSSDPSSSMDLQWRTNTTVDASTLKYKVKGTSKVVTIVADKMKMEDRMLVNDRYSNHYTAKLTGLKPGTTYQYQIASQNEWSDSESFTTASTNSSFSFLWFGDTHYSPKFGEILHKGWAAHPDASFFSIVGDLVSDGLNRDQWDALFDHSKETACKIPFMSVPGNHDNRAGLGAKLYCDLFSYPMNGPKGVPQEQTYSFTYKNALFLMIDATSPIDTQTAWIEKQLAATKATWKIAMFHFAPYNREEPYLDIQKAWVPLFDKYHVDMVYGGHLHYYMRSKPMKAGKVVSSYRDGTAYLISVGIPNRDQNFDPEPYAEVTDSKGQLFQYVKIDGNSLHLESVNMQGKLIDSFNLKK
ncbi:MAG: metallophosphoesterase family protein [Prolixibacteraceae bacterium]|nr:metallophosphoesterase family protein [Prolixibacteraceae bacterium]